MVSKERTKLMTKAELFRQKEMRGALRIDRYQRKDYISYEMIRAGIVFTFAYALVAIVWVLYYAEPLMTQRTIEELAQIAGVIGIIWICLLVCFLVIAYHVFRKKYKIAREQVKEYQAILKQINRLYEVETVKVWKESGEYEE